MTTTTIDTTATHNIAGMEEALQAFLASEEASEVFEAATFAAETGHVIELKVTPDGYEVGKVGASFDRTEGTEAFSIIPEALYTDEDGSIPDDQLGKLKAILQEWVMSEIELKYPASFSLWLLG